MDEDTMIRLILRLLYDAEAEELAWIYSFLRGFLASGGDAGGFDAPFRRGDENRP